jgi:hypothetical protein
VFDDVIIVNDSHRIRAEARRVAAATFAVKCCVVCGMAHASAIDVQHLDFDSDNNRPENLAYMCKTHATMYVARVYTREVVEALRAMWQRGKQSG